VTSLAPAHRRRTFDAQDVTLACAVALFVQVAFVVAFSLPAPAMIVADISNDNAKPIAVAITPVLKLGSQTPNPKMPSPWVRKRPPPPKAQGATPSPLAEKTPEAIPTAKKPESAPVIDAGKPEPIASAAPTETPLTPPAETSSAAPAASTEGSEQGASNGTEADPLKAHAVDMYRVQLAQWFVSRFGIRGKIPFDRLKTLAAIATVTVTPDRKLGSFSIVKPSGDSTFDDEVRATLSRIEGSGTELPAPPPAYPELLGKSFPIQFRCNIQKVCE
jgi:hypothetical protein